MLRRIIYLVLFGTFLLGCKVKQTVSYNKDHVAPKKEVVAVQKEEVAEIEDGVYVMPEDTGEFIRFDIGSPEEYIETFSEIAQFEMKAYGIPASITLAQGLLESGFGRGELALKTNNHFGIKCHTGWQGDFDHHDDDEKGECFRKYNHPMYSYRDHSIFLSERSRYAFLFDLPNTDYKRWAKGLRKAGYATDPRYPQKLIALIERHELYDYDKVVAKSGYGGRRSEQIAGANPEASTAQVAAAKPSYATHIVRSGDTLYSISKRYSVSVNDLKRWNYMYDDKLDVGQELTVKTESYNK